MIFLGSGSTGIGILNFVRSSFVAIIQVGSADITQRLKSRKKFIVGSVFLAAFLWLPTYFVPFLFPQHKVLVFILLFSITSSFNMLATPAWASLMAEYIPHNKRGKFFGWRGTALGIVYSISLLIAGLILHFFHHISLFWTFAALVATASFCRFLSLFFLNKMYEPHIAIKKTDYFSLREFL